MHQRGRGHDGTELGTPSSKLSLNNCGVSRLDTRRIGAGVALEGSITIREEEMVMVSLIKKSCRCLHLRNEDSWTARVEGSQSLWNSIGNLKK